MQLLNVSQVDLFLLQPKNGLIGFANFILGEGIAVNGVGIYQRLHHPGIRLVYPVRKLSNGKQITIIHPIKSNVGSHLEGEVERELLRIQKSCRGYNAGSYFEQY